MSSLDFFHNSWFFYFKEIMWIRFTVRFVGNRNVPIQVLTMVCAMISEYFTTLSKYNSIQANSHVIHISAIFKQLPIVHY
jgi:hypothetical protein